MAFISSRVRRWGLLGVARSAASAQRRSAFASLIQPVISSRSLPASIAAPVADHLGVAVGDHLARRHGGLPVLRVCLRRGHGLDGGLDAVRRELPGEPAI
jgi:hypothetical protein